MGNTALGALLPHDQAASSALPLPATPPIAKYVPPDKINFELEQLIMKHESAGGTGNTSRTAIILKADVDATPYENLTKHTTVNGNTAKEILVVNLKDGPVYVSPGQHLIIRYSVATNYGTNCITTAIDDFTMSYDELKSIVDKDKGNRITQPDGFISEDHSCQAMSPTPKAMWRFERG